MYHSVTLGDKNTWDDWHIVASSRPVINPPEQKTKYLDLPGASGSIDLTESLTGYPVFENREGEIEFYVMNGYQEWNELYGKISRYLHGRRMKLILEDEKEFYYTGRFTIDEWKSDKEYSIITIDYTIDPFKLREQESTEDWLWDSFNFDTGIIMTTTFSNIAVASDDDWTELDISSEMLGRMPVCPTFSVSSTAGNGMDIRYVCEDMNIDTTVHFDDGDTIDHTIYFVDKDCKLYFKGAGTVSVKFRSGEL